MRQVSCQLPAAVLVKDWRQYLQYATGASGSSASLIARADNQLNVVPEILERDRSQAKSFAYALFPGRSR